MCVDISNGRLSATSSISNVGSRMLELYDEGVTDDYQGLLRGGNFSFHLRRRFIHTASRSARQSIEAGGLRVSHPGKSEHWMATQLLCISLQSMQGPGVYVGRDPDWRGIWSHWPKWDVWSISLGELPWEHDKLNPGCWRVTESVPSQLIERVER